MCETLSSNYMLAKAKEKGIKLSMSNPEKGRNSVTFYRNSSEICNRIQIRYTLYSVGGLSLHLKRRGRVLDFRLYVPSSIPDRSIVDFVRVRDKYFNRFSCLKD